MYFVIACSQMEDSKSSEGALPKLLLNSNSVEQSKLEPVYPKLPVTPSTIHRHEDCSSCTITPSAELVTGQTQMYKSQSLLLGENGSTEMCLIYTPAHAVS